jgi:uncharacterized integral membrane protein
VTKWYVFWSFAFMLGLAILYFIFGGALIVINQQFSEEFIQ